MSFNRREFIKTLTTGTVIVPLSACAAPSGGKSGSGKARIVVVGGGFGGATAARYLKMTDASLDVTLVERNKTFVSCPLSNEVISGHGKYEDLQAGYDGLMKRGVNVVFDDAVAIDPAGKSVKLKSGATLNYDFLVLSPGIDFNFGAIEGYSEALSDTTHPHAYKAGPQTLALKKQVESMQDGQVFVL